MSQFPVTHEVLVYTVDEWRNLAMSSVQFYEAIERECEWFYVSE
jgi:hypothetical protein